VVILGKWITQEEIGCDFDIFMSPVNICHFTEGCKDVLYCKGFADFRQRFRVYGFKADVNVGKKGQSVEVFE